MARSRAYRRHQAARARARAYRIARLWHSESSAAEFADFVESHPAWFGVVVSTHCRPCSGSCCFGSRFRFNSYDRTRQSLRADLDYREALAEAALE